MKKKWLALLLAATMAVSLFAGCGSKNDSKESNGSGSKTEQGNDANKQDNEQDDSQGQKEEDNQENRRHPAVQDYRLPTARWIFRCG